MTPDSVLADWRAWQQAQSLSPRTMNDREAVVRHFFEITHCHPVHFTPDDVVMYVGRDDLSASSAATYHATLRAFSRWLVRSGRRMDDPTFHTIAPKRPKNLPRPITDVQLDLLLAAANRRRTRMMILLAAYQGLRIHEIAKFRGSDIDVYSNSISVLGKGNKLAVNALHPAVKAEMHLFPKNGYWFPAYAKSYADGAEQLPHITTHGVYFAIKHTMRRAGYEATPHQIRHWFGTTLLASGVDVMIVKDMMRHESVATTQIYTKITLGTQQLSIVNLPAPIELRRTDDLPEAA